MVSHEAFMTVAASFPYQTSNSLAMGTSKESETRELETFPEGGLRAWATVFGAFAALGSFISVSKGFFSMFLPRMWIGSINALLIISVGLYIGRLYDRGHLCFSRRVLAWASGLVLSTSQAWPSSPTISKKRRALAMSIVASGSSFGAVIHPIMLNQTLHSSLGFGTAVRASAGLVSGLLLLACFIMQPRLPPTGISPEFWPSMRRFSHDTPYVLATLGLAMFSVTFYFPIFFLQLDAVTHGIDGTFSFYSLVIMNASSFVGRIVPGFLAHSLGIANMATASAGCGAVLVLGMIGLSNIASVVVLAILYGFCSGVFITTMAPLVAVLTEDLTELGLRMGLFFAVEGIGGLPLILSRASNNGALHGRDFMWWKPALFSGLRGLLGSAFFLASSVAVRRRERSRIHAVLADSEKTVTLAVQNVHPNALVLTDLRLPSATADLMDKTQDKLMYNKYKMAP
ncbi:major facilitator superfamily domain-containing protein [Mycena olivaceomarginata]|nr:major facilitator superfamily domain-containing protein [Mycena olivaceomarginata]